MERILTITREKGIGLFKNTYVRAVCITLLLILAALLTNAHENFNGYYIKPIVSAISLSTLGLVLPPSRNRTARLVELIFTVALLTYFTYLELEMWQGNNLGTPLDGESMRQKRQLLNWGLIALCFVLGLALFKRPWAGLFSVTLFFGLTGLLSYAVLQFRGETLLPSDIGALQTAMDVAESYHLEINSNVIAAVYCLIVMVIWVWRLRAPSATFNVRTRNSARLLMGLGVLLSAWLFCVTPVEKLFYPWFIPNNGYVFSVMINFKLLQIKPENSYSPEAVEAALKSAKGSPILGKYDPKKSIAKAFPAYKGKKPNIVCVMNESFADLSNLGSYTSDKAVLSNWNKLKKESISGNLVVEVFGGGTSDSEYSFLTGNSTLLFADNARAYELYVKDDISALPKILKKQGYSTYAVHPDKPENWNRNTIYPKLGFDTFQTLETFKGEETMRDGFTSDRATYKRIENIFKKKGKDPAFIFDVTLQNHGSYCQSYDNLDPVKLTDPAGEYDMTEQYLSLVRESDKAFKEMIDYFRDVDEPTVVLMFGDHLPKIEDEFYEDLLGSPMDALSLAQQRKRYTTPFMLWANYDIPKKELDAISVNYLSTLLENVAGTEKTEYNRYLEELYKSFPVVDRKGVMTADGEHLAYSQLTEEDEAKITEYKNIIYNNVFGEEEKSEGFEP